MMWSELNRTLKEATKQNATCTCTSNQTWYDDKLNFSLRADSLVWVRVDVEGASAHEARGVLG